MSRAGWLIAGGVALLAGAVGVAVARRDPAMPDAERVTLFASRLGADQRIPMRVRRWASEVASAALRWVVRAPRWTPEALAALVFGVLERESHGGDTLWLDGTGDHTARVGSYLRRSDVRVVYGLPQGWRQPRDDAGNLIPPPWAIPADGMGWGRGLGQIDYGAHEFARTGNWRDPMENIDYAARRLVQAIRHWTGRDGHGWPVAVLAAASYNAGEGGVQRALDAAMPPDAATTDGNYGEDVLAAAHEWGFGDGGAVA